LLQSFDAEAPWANTGSLSSAKLQHRTTLRQEALEARRKTWLARSTVRTLRPGSWFALTQSTLDLLSALGLSGASGSAETEREFAVHTVHSLGINNLPKDLSQHIACRLGGLVARFCSEVLNRRDDIFGIVHGVMPAIGAAAVYRRFKSGTEDPTGWYNMVGAVTSSALGNDAA
jgi:uncharacterized protein involved in type VI secretion and phage assembly